MISPRPSARLNNVMPNALTNVLASVTLLCIGLEFSPAQPDKRGSEAPSTRSISGTAGIANRQELPPRGIVIFKRHIQPDANASFVEYAELQLIAGSMIDIVPHDGSRLVSISRRQLAHHMVYPQETSELLSEGQVSNRRRQLERMQRLAKQYRRAASSLQPWISRLEHEVTMWDQGFCLAGGKWFNRASYFYDQQVAALREAFEERRAKILSSPLSAEAFTTPPPAGMRASQTESEPSDEELLPPMWAIDLEQQLKEEEAERRRKAARGANRPSRQDQQRNRRSQAFMDDVETERPFRTDWKLEK